MSATPATAATFLLDGDEYVAQGGIARYDGTPHQWTDEFRARGGIIASIHPAWRTGAPDMTLYVEGSDDAVAFAASTAPLAH